MKNIKTNIPNGWQQVKLGDICDFKKGKGLPKDDLLSDGKYEAIHYGELFTKYHEKIEDILSRTNSGKGMFFSKKNDILMPTSDVTPRGLSTASYLNKDGIVLGGDILVIRPRVNTLNGLFFSNFVLGNKKEIMKLVSGTTIFHLYGSDMAKLKFKLPPFSEQNRIVSVLETWDKAIKNLNKKIEIKKQIKKGLMQDLLAGKKRLKGFKDKWETKKLGDLCDIGTGKKNNQDKLEDGKYPFFVRSPFVEHINSYSYDGEAILIPGEGNIGKIFHYIHGKFDFHQRVYKVSDFIKGVSGKYIYFYISKNFSKATKSDSVKATVDSLRLPTFTNFKIEIPSLKEQESIVDVLTTADKEITELEKKLQIIKDQKKFLLNNLITGKIRTPENLKINA